MKVFKYKSKRTSTSTISRIDLLHRLNGVAVSHIDSSRYVATLDPPLTWDLVGDEVFRLRPSVIPLADVKEAYRIISAVEWDDGELRRCPFCGSDDISGNGRTQGPGVVGRFYIECLDCHARVADNFSTEEAALGYWNCRVP